MKRPRDSIDKIEHGIAQLGKAKCGGKSDLCRPPGPLLTHVESLVMPAKRRPGPLRFPQRICRMLGDDCKESTWWPEACIATQPARGLFLS